MNTQAAIVSFLQSKGLNRAAIAGIMGNLNTESGINPGAYNPNEGARGLAQWEGGRRTALQQYASAHGMSETDLNAQLGYMWQELTGPYSHVLSELRNVTDPAQAATIWDSQYEVSAGTTRAQRIANAQQFYGSGHLSGVSTNSSGETQLAGSTGSAMATPNPTAADYKAALGSLEGLLTGVPELKKILGQAVSGGWAVTKFQQAVEQSQWYRTNNAAARELVSLQYSDPTEFKTRLTAAGNTVSTLAAQMGVKLTYTQKVNLAHQFIIQGWDQSALAQQVGKAFNPKDTSTPLGGSISNAYTQLKDLYAQYGVPASEQTLRYRAQQIAEGLQSVDNYKAGAITAAKSMYPSLATQIDSGMTVHDIADPYKQTMANLLEIDPNNIGLNDPLIKKALQGSVVTTGNNATATSTPLWQFEKTLRADPRWAMTNNAKDQMSTALLTVGRDWGFAS